MMITRNDDLLADAKGPTSERPDILIVDDDPTNLRFLQVILQQEYQVRACSDGHEAIRLFKERLPEIVLLDVMMPELSGFDVCRILRQIKGGEDIPVLFLTGMDDVETHVAALDLGVVDYLRKPFSVVNLKLRVRNYVAMKSDHDQLLRQHVQLAEQKRQLEQEIAERQQLEAKNQLLARLSALGEMATGVAHEINNPIAGVIGCAEMLKSRLPADSPCQPINERILRESSRIAAIVRSSLYVAHPGEVGQGCFQVRDSLESVLLLYQSRLDKAGVPVEVEVAQNLPAIEGDRQKFEQLVANLVSNAYYALEQRRPDDDRARLLRLTASCGRQEAETLLLEVYDQGEGIPAELIDRIFDPFFTTKPAGSGTGLGLSLCHEIVRQFGGEIRVDSQPGNYTRFSVELPAARCNGTARA